jgi:hypothetical protein
MCGCTIGSEHTVIYSSLQLNIKVKLPMALCLEHMGVDLPTGNSPVSSKNETEY